MVKRIIKRKKKIVKRKEEADDPASAMQSSALDESDIDEDRPVADLSNIPAPEIEFEMPNLTPMPLFGANTKKFATQWGLTTSVLNNEIVSLRAAVQKARLRVKQNFIRTKKSLEAQLAKKDDPKAKRKIERITEELDVVKEIQRDDVSKFALLNQKTLTQLPLSAEIPVAERCLYRLACEKNIVDAVSKFREQHNDWEVSIPSVLQKMGHPGVDKPTTDTKQKAVAKTASDVEESADDVESEENNSDHTDNEVEDSAGIEESDVSDVDMGTDSDEEGDETIAKRRALLLGLAGIREEKSRPKPVPKKRKAIVDSDEEDMLEQQPQKEQKTVGKKQKLAAVDKKGASDAVANVLMKTLKESTQMVKNVPKAEYSVVHVASVTRPSMKQITLSNQSAAKQVKLSEGGMVKFSKNSGTKKQDAQVKKDDGSDDSGNEGTTSSFFLPADAPSPAASGEESADDDADISVDPVPKKGGIMRKMSSAREKLHQRLEERPMKRQLAKTARSAAAPLNRNMIKKDSSGLPEELHPSWVAKRLAKEQQSARPQGKKTVFADDDD